MADNMGVNPFKSSGGDIPAKARSLVFDYVTDAFEPDQRENFLKVEEIFVVWFVKTLQNWKALVSTSIPDGKYYELTHDGERDKTYVDVYQKVDHIAILGDNYKEPYADI
jgi:hypothetical protein